MHLFPVAATFSVCGGNFRCTGTERLSGALRLGGGSSVSNVQAVGALLRAEDSESGRVCAAQLSSSGPMASLTLIVRLPDFGKLFFPSAS